MKILRFPLFLIIFNFFTLFCFSQDIDEITIAIMEGSKISEIEAIKIEEKIKESPEDLIIRAKLLGFYFSKSMKDKNLRKKYQENVLWVIRNKPERELAGTPHCQLNPHLDGEIYEEGKKIWLENIEKFKENPKVLENAANYFFLYEKEMAEEILKKLQNLNPENPEYFKKLGFLCSLDMKRKEGKEMEETAKRALFQYEKAYSLEEEGKKVYLLSDLAEVSFEAGEIEKAKNYALELLKKAENNKENWFYGNAIHYGNIVLGKIALKEGRKKEAKKYLIEAGKTPGSPQLKSFGPDFSLAEELLKAGEKDGVLEYLKLCQKFWERGAEKIKDWEALIKGGRIPDFSREN